MKKRWKAMISLGLATVVTAGMLAGCNDGQNGNETKDGDNSEASNQEVTLEVEVIYTGDPLEQFRQYWMTLQRKLVLESNLLRQALIMNRL